MSATNTAPHGENTVSLGDEAACVDTADEAIAIIQRHRQACGFSNGSH